MPASSNAAAKVSASTIAPCPKPSRSTPEPWHAWRAAKTPAPAGNSKPQRRHSHSTAAMLEPEIPRETLRIRQHQLRHWQQGALWCETVTKRTELSGRDIIGGEICLTLLTF